MALFFSVLITMLLRDTLVAESTVSLAGIPGSSTLPRKDGSMAACYYNNTIYLIGGDNNPRQLVQIDMASQNITDKGNDTLPLDTYGDSQYYTQINEMFYWIAPESGRRINSYNLSNKTFTQFTQTMHYNVGGEGCLASYNELLFVVGGTSNSGNKGKYQIFNISSGIWQLGPDMLHAREQHTCMVDPDRATLYAILGTKNFGKLVEKLFIGNLAGNTWIASTDMKYGYQSCSAAYYKNTILVFGGVDINDNDAKAIQTIDCTNGNTVSWWTISWEIYATAIVNVYPKIYLFGGYNKENVPDGVDSWQYVQLPTDAPTSAPTTSPTNATVSPTTGYPTSQTNNPTMDPTLYPTVAPTNYPTTPTNKPTKLSVSNPTTSPMRDSAENPNYVSTISSQEGLDGGSSGYQLNGFVIAVISVVSVGLLCVAIIVCYNRRMIMKQQQKGDYYEVLIDKEYTVNTQKSRTQDTNTTEGDSISLQRMKSNSNDDASSVILTKNDDDDEVYQYAPPTHDIDDENQKEGVNGIPGVDKDDDIIENEDSMENSGLPRENNTAHSFSQILNDNVMGVDLMMDDIVNEMDTDK